MAHSIRPAIHEKRNAVSLEAPARTEKKQKTWSPAEIIAQPFVSSSAAPLTQRVLTPIPKPRFPVAPSSESDSEGETMQAVKKKKPAFNNINAHTQKGKFSNKHEVEDVIHCGDSDSGEEGSIANLMTNLQI
jgi:hypothetical protein